MREISDEVAEFHAELRDTGQASVRIAKGASFVLTRSAARRLLNAVAARELSSKAAVYIADCIVASDDIDFEDQATRDAIFFLEDDSALIATKRNRPWTHDEVSQVLASLD